MLSASITHEMEIRGSLPSRLGTPRFFFESLPNFFDAGGTDIAPMPPVIAY